MHTACSAGTSGKARIKVNRKLIDWADVIFVMERKHKELLSRQHALNSEGKQLVVLNIEDNYRWGDTELIEILKRNLSGYRLKNKWRIN